MAKKKYIDGFLTKNNRFYLAGFGDEFKTELDSGCYELKQDMSGPYLQRMEHLSDNIVDLPTKEYDLIVSTIENFLKSETKARFDDVGSIYRMSVLIHGKPGVGKTALINRTMKKITNMNGIVLFNPDVVLLNEMIDTIHICNEDKPILIVLEEFENKVRSYENALLHLLDGEKNKPNTIILATTNFIGQISPRILRSGRMNYLVEVGLPSEEARLVFLKNKLKNASLDSLISLSKKTNNFSIDELKQVINQHYCLNQNLNDVLDRIAQNREIIGNDVREHEDHYRYTDEDEED